MSAHAKILPRTNEMIAYLDRFVRGQSRAKQDIAVAVYNHYLSQGYYARHGTDLGSHHILMLGPTGSGKTYIVKKLAEYLGVPFSVNSAASLVEAGYRGRSVDDVIRPLLDQAKNNPKVAQRGIIFLDEIDKIRRQETGGRDVSGEGVQNSLLTLLDGRVVSQIDMQPIPPIDTRRILFVCTGAFVGLQAIINKRLGADRQLIGGFRPRANEHIDSMPDRDIYSSLCQVQTGDLVEFGLIPEFVGRFATITTLHGLNRDDLRAIVSESTEASPLVMQKQLARLHGIDLEISSGALDVIADTAWEMKTGARGLHRLIGRAVDLVDHRWPELADQGICKVIIHPECITAGKEPELISGPAVQGRIDNQLRAECLAIVPRTPVADEGNKASESTDELPELIDADSSTDAQNWKRVEEIKNRSLDWAHTKDNARKWWLAFEKENIHRPDLVLRLCEELVKRKATIGEFFLAYVYSNVDNIQANLHFLDYTRLKKEEEKKKRGE